MMEDALLKLLNNEPVYLDVLPTLLEYNYDNLVDIWCAFLFKNKRQIVFHYIDKTAQEREQLEKSIDKFPLLVNLFEAHYTCTQDSNEHLILFKIYGQQGMIGLYNRQFICIEATGVDKIMEKMVDYRKHYLAFIIWC